MPQYEILVSKSILNLNKEINTQKYIESLYQQLGFEQIGNPKAAKANWQKAQELFNIQGKRTESEAILKALELLQQ